MRLWRISDFLTLDGVGGLIAEGRWNRVGQPITYLAESSALAMLEVLVNLEVSEPPASFQLIELEAPGTLTVGHWPADADPTNVDLTRDWGEAFLEANAAPLARVPSVVAPQSWNYLLNPFHPEAARVSITAAGRWPRDARLFDRP